MMLCGAGLLARVREVKVKRQELRLLALVELLHFGGDQNSKSSEN